MDVAERMALFALGGGVEGLERTGGAWLGGAPFGDPFLRIELVGGLTLDVPAREDGSPTVGSREECWEGVLTVQGPIMTTGRVWLGLPPAFLLPFRCEQAERCLVNGDSLRLTVRFSWEIRSVPVPVGEALGRVREIATRVVKRWLG